MKTLLFTFILTFYSLLSFAQQFNWEYTIPNYVRAIFDIDGDGICEYITDINEVYDGNTHALKYTFPSGAYFQWDDDMKAENPYTVFPEIDFNGDGNRDLIIHQDSTFIVFDVVNSTILFELNNPGEDIWLNNLIDIDGDGELELVLRVYVSIGNPKTYIYSTGIPVPSVDDPDIYKPANYKLYNNFPNPFNPSTTIRYSISSPEKISIKIYDVTGQLIREINKEHNQAGEYEVVWDGKNNFDKRVSSGAYFYQISAGDFVEAKKMILLK